MLSSGFPYNDSVLFLSSFWKTLSTECFYFSGRQAVEGFTVLFVWFGLFAVLYLLLLYIPIVRTQSLYESLSWAMQHLSHDHSSQDWRWTFNLSWASRVFQTGNSELKLWETSQVVLGPRWPFVRDCAELRAVNMWNGEGGLPKKGSALNAQREAGMKGHIKWRKKWV